MDNDFATLPQNIRDIANQLKSFKNLENRLWAIVAEADRKYAPQNSLPISIPINVFKPTKIIRDNSTQTDNIFLGSSIENNKAKELKDSSTSTNDEDINPISLPQTPFLDKFYDENTLDISELQDVTMNRPTYFTSQKYNNNKTPDITKNNTWRTPEQTHTSSNYATPNNVKDPMKKTVSTSEAFENNLNKIKASFELLYKQKMDDEYKIYKLNKVAHIFEEIIESALPYPHDTHIETIKKEIVTENKTEPMKTNLEIDLKVQLIKQERNDEEEIEDNLTEASDMITRINESSVRDHTEANQMNLPIWQTDAHYDISQVNQTTQPNQMPQPPQPSQTPQFFQHHQPPQRMVENNTSFNQFQNLYDMAQNIISPHLASNVTKNTKHCSPAPAQNVQQLYSNQIYYTNHEPTNRNYRDTKRSSGRGRSAPYQKYPTNSVPKQHPTPTPSQVPTTQQYYNPQAYYQQYYQTNLQSPMQYMQNPPYN